MTRRTIAMLGLAAALLAGCGGGTGLEGTWEGQGYTYTFESGGGFSLVSALGLVDGTWEETDDGGLAITSGINTLPNDEFDNDCSGTDFFDVELDGDSLRLAHTEGICDLSWPTPITLSRQ